MILENMCMIICIYGNSSYCDGFHTWLEFALIWTVQTCTPCILRGFNYYYLFKLEFICIFLAIKKKKKNFCNVIHFVSVVTFCCQWAEAQMSLSSPIKTGRERDYGFKIHWIHLLTKCLSHWVYWKIIFLLNTIIYYPVHPTFMCIYLSCAPLLIFMRMNYLCKK